MKKALFVMLARLMSKAGSIRVRNMQVLRCIPGKVDEQGGK